MTPNRYKNKERGRKQTGKKDPLTKFSFFLPKCNVVLRVSQHCSFHLITGEFLTVDNSPDISQYRSGIKNFLILIQAEKSRRSKSNSRENYLKPHHVWQPQT